MDFFSNLDAELTARSTRMPNIVSLDFVNDPITSGPYVRQHPDQLRLPNSGLYALKPVSKNFVYLEYENRLCNILNTLEWMEPTDTKEDMEDRALRELMRINTLKEIEWSGQRSIRGTKGAVVNTGMCICMQSHPVTITDHTLEKYFVTRHPQNKTLFAIYMTTLMIYVLYHIPRRGVAVLLAGMRSILNSEASLHPLANEVPKDPRKLLTMYDLDPVTRSYICCPSCFSLYPHSVIKTKKKNAPTSSDNPEHDHPVVASLGSPENTQLVAPTHCTHRRVREGSPCGESLFDTVVVNGHTYVVPRFKYEAQDLKQWVGRLLS